jgi:hypothetical protein
MRYYFGENAARPIIAAGRKFPFETTALVGGTVQGVVAVPDDLNEVFMSVAQRFGVVEITKEAYDAVLLKKKQNPRSPAFPDLTGPLAPSSPAGVAAANPPPAPRPAPLSPLPPLKGNGAVIVEGDKVKERTTAELPSGIDDAVDLGTAAPPVSEPVRPKETRAQKQKRSRE